MCVWRHGVGRFWSSPFWYQNRGCCRASHAEQVQSSRSLVLLIFKSKATIKTKLSIPIGEAELSSVNRLWVSSLLLSKASGASSSTSTAIFEILNSGTKLLWEGKFKCPVHHSKLQHFLFYHYQPRLDNQIRKERPRYGSIYSNPQTQKMAFQVAIRYIYNIFFNTFTSFFCRFELFLLGYVYVFGYKNSRKRIALNHQQFFLHILQ